MPQKTINARHPLGLRSMPGCVALATALLFAAPLSAETLNEAVALAYSQNPALKAEQAGSRATNESERQAKAAFGPTLTVSGGYNYTRDRYNFGPSAGYPRASGFGSDLAATIDQPLYTSGRLSAQLTRGKLVGEAGRAQLRSVELQILSAVVTAYVSARRDTVLVDIARENVELLSEQLIQTGQRLKYRDATATDYDQTETRIALGRAQLHLAEGNLETSRDSYRSLVGHYPQNLTPEPPLPPLPISLTDASITGERLNPDLAGAIIAEQTSRAELAIARSEGGPNVALRASAQRSPISPYDDGRQRFSVGAGVNVSLPIYASGLISSRVREAKQRNERDFFLVEQSRRTIRQAIAQNWDQLSANRLAIPAYQESVRAAQSAVVGARKQATAGQLTARDVLDATRDLLTARTGAAQAEADAYILEVNLMRAMGTLDVGIFMPDIPRYDPNTGRPRGFDVSGLPTRPVVQAVDSVIVLDSVKRPTVQTEHDEEPKPLVMPAPSAPLVVPTKP